MFLFGWKQAWKMQKTNTKTFLIHQQDNSDQGIEDTQGLLKPSSAADKGEREVSLWGAAYGSQLSCQSQHPGERESYIFSAVNAWG